MLVFGIFTKAAKAQEPGEKVGTNSAAVGTVPVDAPPYLSPAVSNQFGPDNSLTNLFNVAPAENPLLEPRTVGSTQLTSPLLGTGVFAAPGGAATGAGISGGAIPIWGPVDVHPRLLYSFIFGNGIESQPGQQTKTAVNTISPSFLFDLGTHWKLDYAPSYTIYSDPAFRNTLAHSVILRGGTTYGDWALNLSQTYSRTDDPLIETGMQTAQEAYGTSIGAAHQISSKLSFQMGASQNISSAAQFNSVKAWNGSSGLNYEFIPQFGLGVSLGGGYTEESLGSSMPSESLQGTMNFRPGKRLSLRLSGGVEDLQFIHPTAPSLLTPIFSGSLSYQLFSGTSLTVSGSRSTSPSFFGNQVEVSTSVGASIHQKLSKKFSLSLNAGYSTEPLTSIVPGPLPQFFLGAPPRTFLQEDENNTSTSYGVTLSYAVLDRLSLSAFYSLNRNSSGQVNYSYSSSQVGFSASYTY